jgi:four helix bundle protein
MRNLKKLDVWSRAHLLTLSLHREADAFSGRHRFGRGDRLTRAAGSVGANIAEGAGRESAKEFRRFLTIARESIAELENHLLLARDLGLLSDDTSHDYLAEVTEIRKMLAGLKAPWWSVDPLSYRSTQLLGYSPTRPPKTGSAGPRRPSGR